MFKFLEQREVRLNVVFSDTQSSNNPDDLSICFKKLGYVFEKKIKAWWDIASFLQYIKCKLVPKRLRWDLPPNDGLVDDESLLELQYFFDKKGQELLELLLVRKQRKIKVLDKQIVDLKNKIEPLQDSPDFPKFFGELKTKTVKWDKESQEKKKKLNISGILGIFPVEMFLSGSLRSKMWIQWQLILHLPRLL